MLLSLVAAACTVFACSDITAPRRQHSPRDAIADTATRTIVVSPASMQGWTFYDDQHDTTCTDTQSCAMVQGPGTPPLGAGSAGLATATVSDGKALLLKGYAGTRLDHLTTLAYSTYRQSPDAGNNQAISLQLNVDYDLSDAATGYQGRLVFEPCQGNGGNVPQSTWQRWDAKAGRWWGTKASVPVNGVLVANPCVQATPCTWAQVLAAFPNIGVHATYWAVVLKAGSGWTGFRGNVDDLVIGADGTTTTFDFEPVRSDISVPETAPRSIPQAVYDSAHSEENILTNAPGISGRVTRHTLFVRFDESATQAQKQMALASVGADAVGGMYLGTSGLYYIRLRNAETTPPDSASGPLLRAERQLRSFPFVRAVLRDWIDPAVDIMIRRPVVHEGVSFVGLQRT